ncbi:MAG: O-antigen ligase family protein [Chloroflexi bacterium]|nr:O-antigen ligase family protein [Chloroflexota bacterium]
MSPWHAAWACAPALLALALELSALGQALYGTRRRRSLLAGLQAQPRVLVLAFGLALLSAALSLSNTGRLVLALSAAVGASLPLLLPHSADAPELPVAHPMVCFSPPWWLRLEAALLLLAAPPLLLPTLRPWLALAAAALLFASWLASAVVERAASPSPHLAPGLWPGTLSDPALALFAVAALIAIGQAASQGPEARLLMLPKACALFLSLAAFRYALRLGRAGGLSASIGGYLLVGLGFTTLGLLGGLRYERIPMIGQWLRRLPSLVQVIPETQSGRVSLNQLGGMLTLLLPVALSLALAPAGSRLPRWLRHTAWIASFASFAALLLTQSRGAWGGAAVSLLLLLALRSIWARRLIGLALLVAALYWVGWGRAAHGTAIARAIADAAGFSTPVGVINLQSRVAIWTDALERIGRSPWFGHGLGTFRLGDAPVPSGRSPFDTGMPHAHNVWLQAAYDLGLPGLVALLAIVISACRQAWRQISGQPMASALSLGALSGLTGYHVHGIMDALSVGAKPGLLFWILLGLVFSLPVRGGQGPAGAPLVDS